MVPERFVGVWRRVSIALDGGPAHEPEDVVWLQAPSSFADLRVPRVDGASPVEAFAGTTHWDGSALRWDHELDWHGAFAGTDHGLIDWDGEVMVERGTMVDPAGDGASPPVAYVERWQREPSPGPVVALDGRTSGRVALHVRIGAWALTLARTPSRFAVRLDRPGMPALEVGDAGLEVPDLGHPAWTWTERADADIAVPGPSLPVGAVETVSKQPVPRFLP